MDMNKEGKKNKASCQAGFEPTTSRLVGLCSSRCATTTVGYLLAFKHSSLLCQFLAQNSVDVS